jgi:1-acyl-sn-glycerol-3-phosphate acyltransferase
VLLRRKRSLRQRVIRAARQAPRHGRELRAAASQLDSPWARTWIAGLFRELFLRFVLKPTMDYYTRRRTTGRERLRGVRGPVVIVANHASHMDTPAILAALPRRLRRRTAVAAAADYFYRNRLVATLVSLIFNTVPIDRGGGGLSTRATAHLDKLLDNGWSLLLYPEGTRRRNDRPGRVRRGAAVLAAKHGVSILPIRVSGTSAAMPPGRFWPKRLRGRLVSRRHRVEISFGDPIAPEQAPEELTDRVQRFFEQSRDGDTTPQGDRRERLVRAG